jgi:hypothetical protein
LVVAGNGTIPANLGFWLIAVFSAKKYEIAKGCAKTLPPPRSNFREVPIFRPSPRRFVALQRDLERLEDEFRFSERVETLNHKLSLISHTATTLADIIDTERTLRLGLIVIFLIASEIVVTAYEIYARH